MSSDPSAAKFLEWCKANQEPCRFAAATLEKHLQQLLADENCRALMVTARAKSIESIRAKLLRKAYARPKTQLTDRIGARIILYHAREVDLVAALLRRKLRICEAHSTDKRLALGLREFGYRSYHLVGSVPKGQTASLELWSLRGQVFEIQIRSLLEHVWAEIEHEVIYKSGANWPVDIKRRFASIAGVLELLEHEFDQLEETATALTEALRNSLKRNIAAPRDLDVPIMCAIVEITHPKGVSFREARASGKSFPPGIAQLLLLALRRTGIRTTATLLRALRSSSFHRTTRRYAVAEGIPQTEVSHLALLSLLIASRAPGAFGVFFPELAGDTSFQAALATAGVPR